MSLRSLLLLALAVIAIALPHPTRAQLVWGTCVFSCPSALTCSCASVALPADWGDPSNTNVVSIAVALVVQQGAPVPTQAVVVLTEGCVWENPEQLAVWTSFLEKQGNAAVFTIDARGSGRSTPAYGCPDDPLNQNIPSLACASALSAQSSLYTLRNMALDLNATLPELTVANNVRPPLYLVADGLIPTAWAQKYVELCGDQVKTDIQGMGLSSFTAPEQYNFFSSLLYNPDSVVRRVLALCEEDPVCAPQAGGGRPLAQLLDEMLLAAFQGTLPCNQALATALGAAAPTNWREFYSNLFVTLIGAGGTSSSVVPRDLLSLIPAVLYRILRCAPTDVTALVALAATVSAQNGNSTAAPGAATAVCSQSQPLRFNLIFSEFVPANPLSAETLIDGARRVTGLSPPAAYVQSVRALYDGWTKYTATPFVPGAYAPLVPVLLLAGRLDPITRFQSAAYAKFATYTQSSTSFYEVEQNTHAILYSSPSSNFGGSCVLASMWNWFLSSSVRPCLTAGSPTFDGLDFFAARPSTVALATAWLGTPDLWNFTAPNLNPVPTNPPTTAAPPTPQPTPQPTPVPTPLPTTQPTAAPPTPPIATSAPPTSTETPPTTTATPPTTTTTHAPTNTPPIIFIQTEVHTSLYVAVGVSVAVVLLLGLVIFFVRRRRLQAKRQDYYASVYGSTN